MDESIELKTRREIYDLVLKHPGLHLSKIAEMLKIRISLVEYHLLYLEKNEIFVAVKEKGYKRFYVQESRIGSSEKKILSILRQDVPLRVVLFLLKNPRSSHKEILRNIDKAASTLSYHIKKLVKKDIIDIQVIGKEKGYVVLNEKKIIGIITRYKPYMVLESFKDVWKDLQVD